MRNITLKDGNVPDTWIKQQIDPLRHWIENSKCPMLASMPSGEIVYANRAFADYVGYSQVELVGDGGKSWKELTVDSLDIAADEKNVAEVLRGATSDFTMIKSYRHKVGTPKRSHMHVIRWPPAGEFEVFLVTVIPLDGSWEYALSEIESVKSLIISYISDASQHTSWSMFWRWARHNPAVAYPLIGGLSSLIVGDRVIELIAAIRQAITG